MTDKKNAFDLLRLILATSVLVTHGLLLGGYKLTDPLTYLSKNQTNFSDFGVMGFFALSGYLITASFERSKNALTFLSHRFLRIFPGFWVCLFVTAFLFAPLIYCLKGRALSNFDFFGNDGAASYLINNCLLKIRQWNIRDVLNFSSYQGSLNGSLWSLFPEMQCYCLTLVAGIAGLFHKNKILYLIFSVTLLAFFAINFNFSKSFGPTVLTLSPALALYVSYVAGSLIYVFRDQMTLDKKGTLFLFLFTLMLIKFGGYNLISPLVIAFTLINAFQLFEFRLKYDISYGIYIYGFPVQQLLFIIFGSRLAAPLFILFSLMAAAMLGFLSYVLVEKPFINLRKKTDQILNRFF